MNQARDELEIRATMLEMQITPLFASDSIGDIDSLCEEMGKKTSTRITVIALDGTVIGDTEKDTRIMENHANRPEFVAALGGDIGASTRFSNTLQQNLMYVALPLQVENNIIGAVRTSISVSSIDEELSAISFGIVLTGLIVAIVAALLSLAISRKMSRPLEELKEGARRFADGELDYKLPAPDTDEIRGLAEAMNKMARQLDERIETINRQRNEQEAMLTSMTEGVLAVDSRERIMNINNAVEILFDVHHEEVEGKSIQEAIRNTDLHALVAETLLSGEPVEKEINIATNGERFLMAHGTPLRDADHKRIGALIVLNDLTRIRHLENVRREFVANVSHELKTPITSIKGFVETLLDGPMKTDADSDKFLRIIARQADRLNAIIEDILSLSRIEQESDEGQVELEEGEVNKIILEAVQSCEIKAAAKNIKINRDCDSEIIAMINAPLLEHAVVNLVDNAVKYSDDGKEIWVECRRENDEVIICVRDEGIGISRQHLPRLFERFYRADKARSRKMGGTGLGLAIVKHIVIAHRGNITVETELGKGSEFSIHLPLKKQSI